MIKTGNIVNRDSLEIFDNFRFDENLEKFKRRFENEGVGLVDEDGFMKSASLTVPRLTRDEDWHIRFSEHLVVKIYYTIIKFFKKRFEKPPQSVGKTMHLVKSTLKEVEEFSTREKRLDDAIAAARKLGQKQLEKKLNEARDVGQLENVLASKGIYRYITDVQILEFGKKCEKGLCLDWIQDFVRLIPKEVYNKKVEADSLNVFDNYVILHYDPKGLSTDPKERARQEAKVKDPILFGVIQGSYKLYFVADWVDEKCDLTFREVVKSVDSYML